MSAPQQDHDLIRSAAGASAPSWYGPAVPLLIAALAAVVAIAGG